jgi:hypothetical protein
VLYIDEEMSPRLLRRRVKRLAAGMEPCPETLPFRALSRRGIRLDAPGVTALLADLRRSGFDPDVVIVETFRRVLVGDENTAKDVADFWRAVDPLLRAGKTLIVSHHMKKPQARGSGAVRHRASGSTDVMGAADDALAFERAGKEGFTVEPVKCREAEEAPPFAVSLAEPHGPDGPVTLRFEGSAADFKGQALKATQADALILGALREAPNETLGTPSLEALCRERGISRSSCHRSLARLRAQVRVLTPEPGVNQLPGPQSQVSSPVIVGAETEGGSPPPSSSLKAPSPSLKANLTVETETDPYALFDRPCSPIPAELDEEAA